MSQAVAGLQDYTSRLDVAVYCGGEFIRAGGDSILEPADRVGGGIGIGVLAATLPLSEVGPLGVGGSESGTAVAHMGDCAGMAGCGWAWRCRFRRRWSSRPTWNGARGCRQSGAWGVKRAYRASIVVGAVLLVSGGDGMVCRGGAARGQ